MPAWCCPHKIDDVLLAWEGEQHAVFYDPSSGDTHLIGGVAVLLAEMLAAAPLSRSQIEVGLARELDADVDLAALLDAHLPRLTGIGLLQEVRI